MGLEFSHESMTKKIQMVVISASCFALDNLKYNFTVRYE